MASPAIYRLGSLDNKIELLDLVLGGRGYRESCLSQGDVYQEEDEEERTSFCGLLLKQCTPVVSWRAHGNILSGAAYRAVRQERVGMHRLDWSLIYN